MAKGKRLLTLNFNSERTPKILGLLLLFVACYLAIAFFSYLFTWDTDHDIVHQFSWEIFLGDVAVENWLGRLGAFVADSLVYWGFGVGSFSLVYLCYKYGMALIRRVPLSHLNGLLVRTVILTVVVSILGSFFLQWAEFPVGGVFGQSVSSWVQNFVGVAGTLLLLVFALLIVFVWSNNPDLSDFTWRQLIYETRRAWFDLLSGQYGKTRRATAPPTAPATDTQPGAKPTSTAPEAAPPKPKPAPVTGAQLTFDLSQKSALFADDAPAKATESIEDTELEIVEATPSTLLPSTPDEAPAYKPPVQVVQEDTPNFSEPYDPTLELPHYEHPHLQLLHEYDNSQMEIDRNELEQNKNQIVSTLMNFKIDIEKIKATIGPTVTLYEIVPARGIRISKIKNLEDDIALSLSALGIRIIAPIPGKGTIGIEVPNKKRQTVGMREVLMDERFKRAKMELPVALGKNIQNEVFVADLTKMPHLLIAGATGQGKSVGINVILNCLLYKKHPSQVKLILIDPKKVELFPYARLENHFLGFLPDQPEPIVTDTSKVVQTLNSLLIEMERRYDLLKLAEVRNIAEYNDKFVARRLNPNKGHRFLPYIVLVIDEFADLIMTAGKEVEMPLGRLAQLSRAVGIHLIIATQRPSVNIITGVIKANFPARIAYKVVSKVDSRTILDAGGAEQLTGKGDMLLSVGGDIIRLQSAFIDTPEVERVIDFISRQQGFPEPFFLPEFHPESEEEGAKSFSLSEMDDMLEDAARLVVETQHGSTSMIQRRLKLGYNRAGRIMDQLEALGIVGPAEGSKPREVLYYDTNELERYLAELRARRNA
ncbi:MAG: DNA translocase FtsK 4TM domain-containing protein [Saprospiraceae bacterium]|nr:DNA translocase FtsK [Saprospiraceae bacterium]MDW8230930.1 DNA translocase FtsK 4TM domain-containing protein [Saprospiraceae bacterium]